MLSFYSIMYNMYKVENLDRVEPLTHIETLSMESKIWRLADPINSLAPGRCGSNF